MKKLLLTPLAILATAHFANADLVAHWPLDTDASDATGNGHDGAVVGGTVTFGQPGANGSTGTAASFPDAGHIDVPYDAALNPGTQAVDGAGSFTIALWANSSDNGGFNSPFTAREDNGVSVNGPIIYNNPDGNWSYWAGNNGPPGAWNAINSNPVPLNTWQHVAITYDSATTTRKMFVDGSEVINQVGGVSANLLRDIHIGSGQDDGNNFFWNGLIDDVGLWDEALEEADIQSVMENGIGGGSADPNLQTASLIEMQYDGAIGLFNIEVRNTGETEDLNIIGTPVVGGPDAANFSVDTVPGPIPPGGEANILCNFDPLGGNGIFEATYDIASDDPLEPNKIVTVRFTVHDPFVSAPGSIDFGTFPPDPGPQTTSITITNEGNSRLMISDIAFTGDDAANFGVGPFVDLEGGGMMDVELSFDPGDRGGTFIADLVITSDDPITPTLTIPVIARVAIAESLVAWWPLDIDSSDGSGNGFDGIDQGAITYAQPGANAATGGAAQFTGAEHIDVPWDPALNGPDFSVTLWANATASGGGNFRSPITNRDDVAPGGAFRHGWIIYNTNGGQWSFWNGGGTGGMGAWNNVDVGPVEIDKWLHLAITYDSATNTKEFYIDGTSVSTTNPVAFSPNDSTIGDGLTHEDEDLHIGGGGDTGTSFRWEGLLDDVGLFRTALTPAEVASIMTGGVASVVNTAPFQITSIARVSDTEVEIVWNSRPGATYAIDRAIGGLGSADWEEQDDGTVATTETTSFNDVFVPADAPDVFFRVRILE